MKWIYCPPCQTLREHERKGTMKLGTVLYPKRIEVWACQHCTNTQVERN